MSRVLIVAAAIAIALTLWLLTPQMLVQFKHIVLLLLIAPFAEEVVFRLGLQEGLLRSGLAPKVALIITTLAFAGVHVVTRGAWLGLGVIIPAWLVGRVYGNTRNVAPCIALHMAMNGCWLLALHIGWSTLKF